MPDNNAESPSVDELREEIVDGKTVVGVPGDWAPVMRSQFLESKRAGPHVVLWLQDGKRWTVPVVLEATFNGKPVKWRLTIPEVTD